VSEPGLDLEQVDGAQEAAAILAEETAVEFTGGDPASGDLPPTDVSLGDAAARGTGLTLIAQVIRAVFQFGSLVILARILVPKDFGVVASVTAIVGIADILRDFGLSSAAIQAKRLTNDERSNLFWTNLGLGTVCAVLTIAAAPLIEHIYGNHALGPIVFALALVFVISGANTQFNAELTRSLRFTVLILSDLAGQAAGIVLAIVMALSGAGYWAIVAQQIFTALVIMVLNVGYCRWRPGRPRRDVSIKRFFRFGGGVFGTQIIAYTTKNIDNVAVGAYWGATTLGLYSRAYQLLMTPLNQINAPLTRIALPILARVQDDDVAFTRYLKKAQLVGCYLTATVFAMFTALAGPIVAVLFGPRWHAVAPILAVLSVGGVFRSIEQISYWIFLARGKTGAQFRLYLVTRPILIAMILAGLPWGAVGVAVGCSVGFFLYWAVSLWWCGRATGLDSRPLFVNGLRAVFGVSAPAGLAAFLASLLASAPIARLGLGLLGGCAYLVVAYLSSATVREDVGTLVRFGRRTFGRRGTRQRRPRPVPRHAR
jgi:O-antigen/teichoic acid export membrane protein